MKKMITISAAAAIVASSAAAITTDKITLKSSMNIEFHQLPKAVDEVSKMFSEGMIYGRLRTNTFYWDWSDDTNTDNKAMGVGASLIYKTAKYHGLSGTLGMYTTQNPAFFRMAENEVGDVKAGKDTFSRDKVLLTGDWGLSTVGQAFLEYERGKSDLRIGRQMYHSVFTKSNDTKMIPNTFDGVTYTNKSLSDTTFSLAYFWAQKLRDHENSHDVIAVDGWNENDDSAVNKNLTKAVVGLDNRLSVASIENSSVENLKLMLSDAYVTDIFNNLTLEAHYKIGLGGKYSLTPGVRYMMQTDLLGAAINVSNLKGSDITGYTNPTSLDGSLFAARLDLKNGPLLVRYGYSKIADKADIIAPWRGFATGGFTRAMAQYNWNANTVTNMIRIDYDFGKAGVIPGFKVLTRYAIQDFDENKVDVQGDSNVVHIDLTQELSKALEMKIRMAFVDAEVKAGKDVSYNEYRLEFNYLF